MGSRNVNTNELRNKYHMNATTVVTVLKKAKISPCGAVTNGRGTSYEWPNRQANAVLREFREAHPARGSTVAVKQLFPRAVREAASITQLSPERMAKRIDDLATEVRLLNDVISALTPGLNKIISQLG
jgi:hypothetical protein